jgi:organic radical activating enzyme
VKLKAFCLQPFFYMDFASTRGDIYCCCQGWIKESCGSIKDNSVLEVWNGPRFREMRERMLEGQWEDVCNPVCPMVTRYRTFNETIEGDNLKTLPYMTPLLESEILAGKTELTSTPTTIILSNSGLCNNQCIMCAWKDSVENPELLDKAYREIQPLLPNLRELILTGGGEPFARPDTRAILLGKSFEHLKIRLITNGVLLPKYWERIKHHNFSFINVSVDAATKQTYETIHRKSRWEDVVAALDLLKGNKHRFTLVLMSMTVMKENYREIPRFVDLAKTYGFRAQLSRVREYGDLDPSSNFFDHDQEMLGDFTKVLRSLDPEDIDKAVSLTNLIGFYQQQ